MEVNFEIVNHYIVQLTYIILQSNHTSIKKRNKRNLTFEKKVWMYLKWEIATCKFLKDRKYPQTSETLEKITMILILSQYISVILSCHSTISSSVTPFLCPQSFPTLFRWVSSSHQGARVLDLQHQSFQWIFRVDFLYDWPVWSPCCPGDFQESSPAS